MNVQKKPSHTRHGHLVIHSVNAAGGQKSIDPTELALNLADHDSERADIILMQELWVGIPPRTRMAVKTYPNYNIFLPVDTWDSDATRLRSLVYVRKHFKADQLRPYRIRDITWVKVRGITFASVYRPSDDPRRVDAILEAWILLFDCVVAGDFNAGDSLWDKSNPNYYSGAGLAETMYDYGLDLILEPNVATQDGGNVLDLVFLNVPMAEAQVSEALHSTLDYEMLRIVVLINEDLGRRSRNNKWTVPDDRLPELASTVKDRVYELPLLGSGAKDLDRFA